MNIKGAIFDMDGTLTDSMFVWLDIGKRYLISCGITPHDELFDRIENQTLEEAAKYFRTEYGLQKSAEDMYSEINTLVEPVYRSRVFPKEGVIPFLDSLRERGIKLAVASATDDRIVEMVLEKNNLRKYFSCVMTCNMVGADKSSPLVYEKAREIIGTPIEQTVVFEDALFAIKTAKEAGFPVAGVFDRSQEKSWDEIKSLSDFYIEDYKKFRLPF